MVVCRRCWKEIGDRMHMHDYKPYCWECYLMVSTEKKRISDVAKKCSVCGRALTNAQEMRRGTCSSCIYGAKQGRETNSLRCAECGSISARLNGWEGRRVCNSCLSKLRTKSSKPEIKTQTASYSEERKVKMRCGVCGKEIEKTYATHGRILCERCAGVAEQRRKLIESKEDAEEKRKVISISPVASEEKYGLVRYCSKCKRPLPADGVCQFCKASEERTISASFRLALPASVSRGQGQIKVICIVSKSGEEEIEVVSTVEILDIGKNKIPYKYLQPGKIRMKNNEQDFEVLFDIPETAQLGNLSLSFSAIGSSKQGAIRTEKITCSTLVQKPPKLVYVEESLAPREINSGSALLLKVKNEGEANAILSTNTRIVFRGEQKEYSAFLRDQIIANGMDEITVLKFGQIFFRKREKFKLTLYLTGSDSNEKKYNETLEIDEIKPFNG